MALELQRVAKEHDRQSFDCGKEPLNQFLRKSARQQDERGLARTYVLVDSEEPRRVIGYFTLCAGGVEFEEVPAEIKKKLPQYRVPTALLARLALDKHFQGRGYGGYLLIASFRKVLDMQSLVGVSLFEVDAMDEEALAFYRKYGFQSALSAPMKLFLPMATVKEAVEIAATSTLAPPAT